MKTIGLTNEQALINMVDLACHLDQLIPVKNGQFSWKNVTLPSPMDPSTFLGSVWGMIDGVKYLLRHWLDP